MDKYVIPIFVALQDYWHRCTKSLPAPWVTGFLLILVAFPAGVAMSLSTDPLVKYLAGYMSSLTNIGIGFILAFLYVDKFKDRALSASYKEVDDVTIKRLNERAVSIAATAASCFLHDRKNPDVDIGSDLISRFFYTNGFHYGDDRFELISEFKSTVLSYVDQIDPKEAIDEQNHQTFLNNANEEVHFISDVCMPRVIASHLTPVKKRDLLILEEQIADTYRTVNGSAKLWDTVSESPKHQTFLREQVCQGVYMILGCSLNLVMVTEQLLRETPFRKEMVVEYQAGRLLEMPILTKSLLDRDDLYK